MKIYFIDFFDKLALKLCSHTTIWTTLKRVMIKEKKPD